MTFRQVLDVLWQRRWIVAVVMLLAIGFAYIYQARLAVTYSSTATVRLSADATAAATGDGGAYGSIQLDVDSESITSLPVLQAAAKTAKESDIAGFGSSITASVIEGVRNNKIAMTAVGADAAQSQTRADAMAKAYVAYLDQEARRGRDELEKRRAAAIAQINRLPQKGNAETNPVISTELASATQELSTVTNALQALDLSGDPATVLSVAGPGVRMQTSPKVIFTLALITGLLAGMGIALLRDQFDDRIRTERETEGISGVPSLGELAIDRRRRRDRAMVATASPDSTPFSEGVRALRTSLQVLTTPREAVIVVTSPEPGDGKTLVAANLAVSWARTGKSVILVSSDLRRPRLATYFGDAATGLGVADLINGETAPTKSAILELLQPTAHENLRILPAGESVEDPADLLATQALGQIMGHLREIADVVLIDTPPAAALADAAIVASHADGVIVLTSLRRTKRATLVETVRALRAQGATIFGTVSNMSRRRLPKSYQSYGIQSRPRLRRDAQRPSGLALDSADSTDWGDSGRTSSTA